MRRRSDEGESYSVGYGKPPRGSRFRPGQSGNPRGRPKGAKNSTTILERALDEQVVVNEDGKRKRITKREAIYKQQVNKAATGDYRAAQLVINKMREDEARLNATEVGREIIEEVDQLVFQNFLKRLGS